MASGISAAGIKSLGRLSDEPSMSATGANTGTISSDVGQVPSSDSKHHCSTAAVILRGGGRPNPRASKNGSTSLSTGLNGGRVSESKLASVFHSNSGTISHIKEDCATCRISPLSPGDKLPKTRSSEAQGVRGGVMLTLAVSGGRISEGAAVISSSSPISGGAAVSSSSRSIGGAYMRGCPSGAGNSTPCGLLCITMDDDAALDKLGGKRVY